MTDLEIMTKNAIYNYLHQKDHTFDIIEGEDPPDYYYIDESHKIPLELTSTVDVFIDNNNIIANRFTTSKSLTTLFHYLNDKYCTSIPDNIKYLFHIETPLTNYRKFKTNIETRIHEIINDSYFPSDKAVFENISGNKVRIKRFIFKDNHNGNHIVGSIGVKLSHAIINVKTHTDIVLSNAIKQKEIIMKSFSGAKWLGIYCNNFFDESNNFKRSLKEFKGTHSFSRIFLVFKENELVDMLF